MTIPAWMKVSATEILEFWKQAGPKAWFTRNPEFDKTIAERFSEMHFAAARGALSGWESSADGAFALLVLTDQFPRNMWRDSAHAFATDALARAVAERAMEQSFDQAFEPVLRQFFYLPLQHHEDADSQTRAVALYEKLTTDGGPPECLEYSRIHADLISRFGRFPHRNLMMGRISTPEEIAYLQNGGFAG